MNGFGGAGAFSDGKYNITNDFGGTLYEYIGKKQAMELMHYVDEINMQPRRRGHQALLHRQHASSRKPACSTTCTCWTPPSAIWARTSTIVVLENLYDELKA